MFGVAAIGNLHPDQIDQLLSKDNNPYTVHVLLCSNEDKKARHLFKFQKYFVDGINKLPERKVGRVVRIMPLYHHNGERTVLGLCLNKYKKPDRIEFSITYSPTMPRILQNKRALLKKLVKKIEIAFNQKPLTGGS